MAGPTMKATELLRCTDTEFDASIKQLGMKGLLDTISVLQKEMSREQENFNSLSSELSSLKRNSQQYKQIQREMTSSQTKLTSLMNRSMKCFQQQGNHHINKGESSPAAERETSQASSAPKHHSAHIDEVDKGVTNSTPQTSHSKSTPNIAQEVAAKPKVLTTFGDSNDSKGVKSKSGANSSVNSSVTSNSSVISVKPQLSSSQPSVLPTQSNHSNSDSIPKKSSVLTVSMNNTAKTTQGATASDKSKSVPNGKSENDASLNVSGVKQNVSVSNDQEKRHSSSISVIPQTNISEKVKPDDITQKVPSGSSQDAKVVNARKDTPAVVFQGNRPYIVDQKMAQSRETMLDQIRNFQRKSDSEPKVVSASNKETKEIYNSNSGTSKDELKSEKDEKNAEVDSGAEEGSGEPSPESEKYVSKFSFPQKPKRDPAKLEEKKKAANLSKPDSKLPVQEEITFGATNSVEDEEQQKEAEEEHVDLSAEEKALAEEGRGIQEVEDDEIAPVRVNLTSWNPTKLLKDLYSINLMSDTTEDISDKFIAMEGLMEKLPMNKKKATLLKTWKRRFFRAKDGWLHYFETGSRDKPSDSLQLMGGKVDDLGNRILGVDDGRGRYLMVRCPTDKEYGQWKLALESQTADNVRATYVRPAAHLPQHPDKSIIIIDIGSSGIRAGILGEQATLPQLFFPSTVARHKKSSDLVTGIEAYTPEVRHNSDLRKPVYPTEKVDKFGIDIETIGAVFKKIFTELGADPSKFFIMISTPQNLGDKLRASLMEILIDQFRVKGVCMVMQALLALYSYNATSGIIVDIGERMEILPIYDGYVIEGGVSRQSYGGQKVGQSLNHSLEKYKFSTPIQQLLVRYVMEQSCYVTTDYKDTMKKCEEDPDSYKTMISLSNYDLPEGADVTVTHDYSCFKSPEGFFNTDIWGMDYPCVHKLVFKAIQSCPMDGRKRMYRAVYLSGGVTLLPGFAERLQLELSKLAPPSVVVEVHAAPNRYHSAFIGACALANMEQFQQIAISAEEWKREGVKAFRKWKMS